MKIHVQNQDDIFLIQHDPICVNHSSHTIFYKFRIYIREVMGKNDEQEEVNDTHEWRWRRKMLNSYDFVSKRNLL